MGELEELERQTLASLAFLEEIWEEHPDEVTGRQSEVPRQSTISVAAASTSGRTSKLVERVRSSRQTAADVQAAMAREKLVASSYDLRQKSEALGLLGERVSAQEEVVRELQEMATQAEQELGDLQAMTVPPAGRIPVLERRLAERRALLADNESKLESMRADIKAGELALRAVESDVAALQGQAEQLEDEAEDARLQRQAEAAGLRHRELAGAERAVVERGAAHSLLEQRLQDEEERLRKQVEDGRAGRQKAILRLREQHARIKSKAAEADQAERSFIQERSKALLQLRRDIQTVHDELRRRNAIREMREQEKQKQFQLVSTLLAFAGLACPACG